MELSDMSAFVISSFEADTKKTQKDLSTKRPKIDNSILLLKLKRKKEIEFELRCKIWKCLSEISVRH